MAAWQLRTDLSTEELNLHLRELEAAGLLGIAEEGGRATAYFPARREVSAPGTWEPVEDVDWLERWRSMIEPVRVGRFVITPPWAASSAEHEVVIEPAQAFGTGHHETTTGCLAALQALEVQGRSVLDVGCGTGVLAICASRLGAERVLAVDTDALAVAASLANAARNGVRLEARPGSVDGAGDERFDVVLANLDTSTLCRLAAALAARLTEAGSLIASGVSTERAPEALEALEAAGLRALARPGREWVVFVCRQAS